MCATQVSAIRGSPFLGRKTNSTWSFVARTEAAHSDAFGVIANG
jgi:hypothetical protein